MLRGSTAKSKPKITYEASSNRFLVEAPVWFNDRIRKLPNRRWMAKRMLWAVANIRQNVDALLRWEDVEVSDEARAALNRRAEKNRAPRSAFPTWYGFKTKPRNYQQRAIDKLYGLSAFALHMEQGTGKSKTAIDLMSAARMEGLIEAVLIICKVSLRETWRDQFREHCPIEYDLHCAETGSKATDRWLGSRSDFKVMVIGLESLSQGRMGSIAERFMLTGTKIAVLVDESSMISNHQAIRTKKCIDLGRMASMRGTLTGTPMSEGPMNLFSQFEFMDPDIIGLGDFYAFRNRYALMGGYNDKQVVGYANLEELAELVEPYVFEVRKSEALPELPEKSYTTRYVTMTKEQRRIYDEVRHNRPVEVNGVPMAAPQNALEMMLRLRQIAAGYWSVREVEKLIDGREKKRYETHPIMQESDHPKLIELFDILEESGKKQVIIWCTFVAELEMVAAALIKQGKQVVTYYGLMTEEQKDASVKLFQSGKVQYFVGNPVVGGMGITLTKAEVVVYMSNSLSLIDRLQSEDRAHRLGQHNPVLYVDIVCEKSIDVRIAKLLQDKIDVTEYVRGLIASVSKREKKLTLAEIVDLVENAPV